MLRMRRAILIGVWLLTVLFHVPAVAVEEPEISARSAILMDRASRRVLWKKDEHRRLPIASTTKIITALLALERGSEEERIKVSRQAAETEGSSIWLEEGEIKTLGELLYGLMLRSGNDAAAVIAGHVGGTGAQFVELMNERALALGAKNTCYINPHGLPGEGQYSTAFDQGLIACAALDNSRFREIVSTPVCTISWPGQPWDRIMSNQNRLLELYPGGDGVKTGWTREAGRCFAGSATRNGWQLVCVLLDAPQMWEDAAALLDYGFQHYKHQKIFARNDVVCTAKVNKGCSRVAAALSEDLFLALGPGEKELLRYRIIVDEPLMAPLAAGEKVGAIEVYLDGQLLGRAGLCAGRPVARKSLFGYLKQLFGCLLHRG